MVVSSIRTRLTRTSSDLRMLSAALFPPSPILKAGDLSISLTSGEIPILLEATAPAYDSWFTPFGEPPGLRDVAKEPDLSDKRDTTLGNTRGGILGDEALLENQACGESDNTCPAELPKRSFANAPGLGDPRHSETIPGEPKNAVYLARDDTFSGETGRSSVLCDRPTPVLTEQGNSNEELRDPQGCCPCTVELSTRATPKEDLDGDPTIATFHTCTTLPTPTFAPPSPSSSTDVISPLSSPVGRRHRRPLERARAVRFPGRPRSPRLQVTEAGSDFMRGAPPSANPAPRRQLTDPTPPWPTYPCATDTRASDAAHPFVNHVILPEEFSWIKHVVIELWIDQEGFRAVKSRMQLMGYSPRTRSLHPYGSVETSESGVTGGVAEFMPTKRETFAFHYAALDSPPTLRMVSVAGDESRDYISRQATLSVKTNGVYTVLGAETFVASMLNSDTHGLRLCWKFDYLVSDRKVDGTGKTLPGEKTLTPLTFSCSPYLFHPLQGKKTGLMHIMKKNLAPKLGSQKLQPPTSHGILPPISRYLSTRDASPSHARSRSDAFGKKGHCHSHSLARSPLDAADIGGGTILGMNHVPRVRRRRASSAGENSLTCARNGSRLVEGTFAPLFR